RHLQPGADRILAREEGACGTHQEQAADADCGCDQQREERPGPGRRSADQVSDYGNETPEEGRNAGHDRLAGGVLELTGVESELLPSLRVKPDLLVLRDSGDDRLGLRLGQSLCSVNRFALCSLVTR